MEQKAPPSRLADGERNTILAVVSDLLIEVRIEAAAQLQGAGVQTASPRDADAMIRTVQPALVVADLAVAGLDLTALAAAARETGATVVGFYPHVDVNLRRAAQSAGIAHVYARSRFLRELPKILAERLQP